MSLSQKIRLTDAASLCVLQVMRLSQQTGTFTKPTGSSLTSLSSFSSLSSSLPSFRVSQCCDQNQVGPDRLDVLENVEV